jgi:hypothetical protein
MVKQYRKLDDQIITRLNRAQAQFRDQSRIASSSQSPVAPEAMCAHLWFEMMCKHRLGILSRVSSPNSRLGTSTDITVVLYWNGESFDGGQETVEFTR